jgi:hypothetical protein
MKTPELIASLASDLRAVPERPRIAARLAVLTTLASLISLGAILLLLSRSPHLAHGPTATATFTALAGIALAAGAVWAALQLSHPDSRAGFLWLTIPAAILLTGLTVELADAPRSTWAARFWGGDPLACFLCVTALSLPILAAVLLALRDGAPARPRHCGAAAGLLSGGIAMALYTLHCPENSLLFIAAWHVLAVLAVTLCGALAAERILRW